MRNSIGESAFDIDFNEPPKTMNDLIKRQGAFFINLAETFKNERNSESILQVQEKFEEAIKLLIDSI